MTNNLRFYLGLIVAVLIFLICVMMPFLLFEKTQIYKDNLHSLFGYSEVVMTTKDKSKVCYIADFDKCDTMLYRGNEYQFKDLDAYDRAFFESIWSKDNNKFGASPVEFGELTGRQNVMLDDFVMGTMVVMFLFGVCTTICYVMPTLLRFTWRDSK